MRPHRLRLTAFGPFADQVDLDVDDVAAAGPFLLHGPTGAGKTSLLDAIGFALFGRVPGARAPKRLRSDHAPDGVRTSVELWASVGGRAVHVVRTPDQRRRKARGGGWTTDKASVSVRVARDLQALDDDDCDTTFSGVQEANDELRRLVGMTHEQFFQVVLLPQGEFAQFLRAKDEDRAAVLRALFDTDRFGAVEQDLKDRARTAQASLDTAAIAADRAAERVAALVGTELDDVPTAGRGDWAQGLLDTARSLAAAAAARAEETSVQESAARRAREDAAARLQLLRDVDAAEVDRARLLAAADGIPAVRAELDAADRAAEVAGLRQAVEAAEVRAEGARTSAGGALADLEPGAELGAELCVELCAELCVGAAAGCDPAATRDLADRLARRREAAVAEVARLGSLRPHLERWQALVADRVAEKARARTAGAEVGRLRARAAELPAEQARLGTALLASRALAATRSDAEHEIERWRAATGRLDDLRARLSAVCAAETADLSARTAARDAEAAYDALREARLRGIAAELAQDLQDGEACRVCGATEHPAPAEAQAGQVDADAEARAAERATQARDLASQRGGAVADAAARCDAAYVGLQDAVAPQVAVPALAALRGGSSAAALDGVRDGIGALRDAAAARADSAAEAGRRVEEDEARLSDLRTEQASLLDALAAAQLVQQRAEDGLNASRHEVGRLQRDLAVSLGSTVDQATAHQPAHQPADQPTDRPTDRSAQQAVDATAEALDAALGRARRSEGATTRATAAVEALASALDAVDRARAVAFAGCRERGWDDRDAAAAAERPRAWRDSTRAAVARHEREQFAVEQKLRDLTVRLGDDHGQDVSASDPARAAELFVEQDERLAAAEQARAGAAAVLARSGARADGLARDVPRLVGAERAVAPLREHAVRARALADLCSGTNDKGIPLSTYVLAAHLEQVVEAANSRLHRMSEGRYALAHVEEAEDRRRRAGLGLAVLDAWTGTTRPAGTLSGGETFLASLALALGLADVVTAEAGGTRIDALFVDEGFGTLDPDSLDLAMEVLDDLQVNGRLVGVVSHVDELRRRLPRQVHVRRERTGSSVAVSTG